jgi:hypothetical protein
MHVSEFIIDAAGEDFQYGECTNLLRLVVIPENSSNIVPPALMFAMPFDVLYLTQGIS